MQLSIIIPVLNEEAVLPFLLKDLASSGSEVIVVDGGSTDRTMEAARAFEVRAITSPAGRAAQMNVGAAAATGDLLWFLHADTKLPPDWKSQIERAMADPRVAGGGFRVRIDAPGLGCRFLDAWGWLRTMGGGSFYGDQGIFVRGEIFKTLGGFSEGAALEDLDFSTRMRCLGKVRLLLGPLRTSARRWQKEGWWRTVFTHSRMTLSYHPVAIVIMAKAPIPGKVKTRLTPPLSPAEAALLARRLLQETARTVQGLEGPPLVVAVEPSSEIEAVKKLIPKPAGFIPQGNGDFGLRLSAVFRTILARGYRGAMALGADHPNLPARYLKRAVRILSRAGDQAILGPTEDGGYYLIGLTQPHPELFEGIPWSSARVLAVTLRKAKALNLTVTLLPSWYDVDRPEDLGRC